LLHFEDEMTTEELKSEFQKRGIHLVFTSLEGDGVLFERNGVWYCFVNYRAPSVRQRWTMAHELGHFDLHRKAERRALPLRIKWPSLARAPFPRGVFR
jgi:Zn-dependent peptidase ImmA (M78 family)